METSLRVPPAKPRGDRNVPDKTLFGDRISARRFDAQSSELFICCAALNRMTQLGMPDSDAI